MNSFTKIENLLDYSKDSLNTIRAEDRNLQNEKYEALVSYIIDELDSTLNKMNREQNGGRKKRKTRKRK